MDGDGFTPDSTFNAFSEAAMDLDFIDELFYDGCWLETTNGSDYRQPGHSNSDPTNDLSLYLPFAEPKTSSFGTNQCQNILQEEAERKPSPPPHPPPLPSLKIEELLEKSASEKAFETSTTSEQPDGFLVERPESGRRWWIAPVINSSPSSSVKERLVQAVGSLQELMKDRDFLIQIWVPVNRGGKNVLTTEEQPYTFNPNYASLASYRDVSASYSFPADEDSKEAAGLPGRVFLGKLPEWTPDVRFFQSKEYPRILHARKYDVRGSLALPVFERGSGTCLGVIEIVTTSQQTKYRPELESICRALEAFDLRSSNNLSSATMEVRNELYQAALPEIAQLLQSVLGSHRLPLALTWAPCAQLGRDGCRHSDENYSQCLSTIDSACFGADEDSRNFLDACSEHHLLQSEGIVGRAFQTNKQCFAIDVTAFSKTNYPLSHHARISGLGAALAIPLRSVYTGLVELVIELFLPKDCTDSEGQTQMLNSLTTFTQLNFRSSHFVMDKDLEVEVILPVKETMIFSESVLNSSEDQKLTASSPKETTPEESSWIAHMMEANRKGKGVSLSWEYQKEEPKDEFKVTNAWDNTQFDLDANHVLSGLEKFEPNSGAGVVEANGESSSSAGRQPFGTRKPTEKRRTKAEKTISLDILRQYFAGSLKDAAKSIGVCPTTLKRICRQHGISRWPSRKIKKVGHSLRKLQLVIDSVQGVEGSIQLDSFYTSFPELNSPNFSGSGTSPSMKIGNSSKQPNTQPENSLFSHGAAAPKSPSSSCSHSSGSSTCCSTGAKQNPSTVNASSSGNTLVAEDPHCAAFLKRARSDAQLHVMSQEEKKVLARTQSHKTFSEHPKIETLAPTPGNGGPQSSRSGFIKVKATFGDSKVRLSLQTNSGFRDLQREIARRFNIDDISRFDLKYLDDDRDWVLLTCDADLEECVDMYKLSQNHTIKIAIHQASQLKLGSSFGSTAPS